MSQETETQEKKQEGEIVETHDRPKAHWQILLTVLTLAMFVWRSPEQGLGLLTTLKNWAIGLVGQKHLVWGTVVVIVSIMWLRWLIDYRAYRRGPQTKRSRPPFPWAKVGRCTREIVASLMRLSLAVVVGWVNLWMWSFYAKAPEPVTLSLPEGTVYVDDNSAINKDGDVTPLPTTNEDFGWIYIRGVPSWQRGESVIKISPMSNPLTIFLSVLISVFSLIVAARFIFLALPKSWQREIADFLEVF